MIVTVLPDKIRFGADDFVPRFLDYSSKLQILPGQTVTFSADTDIDYIEVGGTLRIARTGNFHITFRHLFVLPTGYLDCGTEDDPITGHVEFIIKDFAIDKVRDPFQWGNGLVNFGQQERCGLPKLHGSLLTAEAKTGATSVTLAGFPLGWNVGDEIVIPDTRQPASPANDTIIPQRKEPTLLVTAIDPMSKVVTFAPALTFDHDAIRTPSGELVEMPYVANLTRNIVVRSQNPDGTPGHTADVGHDVMRCVCYNEFVHLGRTKNVPLDSVKKNADGSYTAGTNQVGRYTDHVHHVMGMDAQTYGNAYRGHTNGSKWGLAIHNTHDTTAHDNVSEDFKGAAIVIEDGNEVRNALEDNVAIDCVGNNTGHMDMEGTNLLNNNPGAGGNGIWARGVANYFRRNRAYGCPIGLNLFNQGIVGGLLYPSIPGGEPDTPYNPFITTPFDVSDNVAVGSLVSGLEEWSVPTLVATRQKALHNGVFGLVQPTSETSAITLIDPILINHGYQGDGTKTSAGYTRSLTLTGTGKIQGFFQGVHDGAPYVKVAGLDLQNEFNIALHATSEYWEEDVLHLPVPGKPHNYVSVSQNYLWDGQLPLPKLGSSLGRIQSGSRFHVKNWQRKGKDYQLFTLQQVSTEPAWWATNDYPNLWNCPIRGLTQGQSWATLGWGIQGDSLDTNAIIVLDGVTNLARLGLHTVLGPPHALMTYPNRYETAPDPDHNGIPGADGACYGLLTGDATGTKAGAVIQWDSDTPMFVPAPENAPEELIFRAPRPLAEGDHTVTLWRVDTNGAPIASTKSVWPFTMGPVTPPETVTVPDVAGQMQAAAQSALTSVGLVSTVTTKTDAATKGIVLTQNPAAGTKVPKGSTVALVVSDGPTPVEVWTNAQAQTSSTGRARLLKPDGTAIELQVKP